jgi:hypothetical protein
MPDFNDPKHWRGRAAEPRARAGQMTDRDGRQMMLGIAEDYEKLAKLAEERAKQASLDSLFLR